MNRFYTAAEAESYVIFKVPKALFAELESADFFRDYTVSYIITSLCARV